MSAFSTAFFGAVIVLATVATASAGSTRAFYDDSGAWQIQDASAVWPEDPGSVTAAPPIYLLPTTVQEPLTLRAQERLDLVQGHIG